MTDVNVRFSESGEYAWLIKYTLGCLDHLVDKFPEEMPKIDDGDLLLFIMDVVNKKFSYCYNLTKAKPRWENLKRHNSLMIGRVKKIANIFL